MAEEKNGTEQTTAGTEPMDETVKPAVKKKAAKKKVAKKATARKTTAKKTAAPAGDATAAPPGEPAETSVATGDSAADKDPFRVEAAIKLKEQEAVEETEMSSDTKTPGGFGLKVIFWLVVIVIGFIWIRSLAKHPGEEARGVSQSEEQAVTATMPEASISGEAATAPVPSPAQAPGGGERSAVTDALASPPAAASASSAETAGTEETMENASEPTRDEAAAAAAAEESASADDRQAESVAEILQEFDDLRKAARTEMEAMRDLIQAQRDLREAMPPPPAYPPPEWRDGSSPYAPPPSPYDPQARP